MTAEELVDFDLIKTAAQAAEDNIRAKATAKADLLAKLGITEDEAKLLLS